MDGFKHLVLEHEMFRIGPVVGDVASVVISDDLIRLPWVRRMLIVLPGHTRGYKLSVSVAWISLINPFIAPSLTSPNECSALCGPPQLTSSWSR